MSNPTPTKLDLAYEKIKNEIDFQLNVLKEKIVILNTFEKVELGIPVARLLSKYFEKKGNSRLKVVFSYRGKKGEVVEFEYKDMSKR